MKKSTITIVLIIISSLLVACGGPKTNNTSKRASTSPFGRYNKTVKYTLANLIGANNSSMPKGDNYENNAYTRYLKKILNIQNVDVLESKEPDYYDDLSMLISSGKLPDVMVITNYDDLKYLVDNDLIADLTSAYKNCASKRIKEIYKSYSSDILDSVTFNNKLMAIPETNIDDGPNLFWVRDDWLKKLNLSEPKTLDDVVQITKAFQSQDPGNNGPGNTLGLMVDSDLTGGSGYSAEYLLDLIFAFYNSYPKQWIKDENGQVVYGSVTKYTKTALEKIRELYSQGVIDNKFLLRTKENIIENIISGKSGTFFGPWWAPNNPLITAVSKDKNAIWKPYLISNNGVVSYHSSNPSNKWVVVRKGYKHPEIVCKIISVIFDYLRYGKGSDADIDNYYAKNVDPTARPISINVDYKNALIMMYNNMMAVKNKQKKLSEIPALDQVYYKACQKYLQNPKKASSDTWAAYASRIESMALIASANTKVVDSLYFGNTKTMNSKWWQLSELEKDSFIQIIVGKKPLDYFDTFVATWKANGGDTITDEVRLKVNNNSSQ